MERPGSIDLVLEADQAPEQVVDLCLRGRDGLGPGPMQQLVAREGETPDIFAKELGVIERRLPG